MAQAKCVMCTKPAVNTLVISWQAPRPLLADPRAGSHTSTRCELHTPDRAGLARIKAAVYRCRSVQVLPLRVAA